MCVREGGETEGDRRRVKERRGVREEKRTRVRHTLKGAGRGEERESERGACVCVVRVRA